MYRFLHMYLEIQWKSINKNVKNGQKEMAVLEKCCILSGMWECGERGQL